MVYHGPLYNPCFDVVRRLSTSRLAMRIGWPKSSDMSIPGRPSTKPNFPSSAVLRDVHALLQHGRVLNICVFHAVRRLPPVVILELVHEKALLELLVLALPQGTLLQLRRREGGLLLQARCGRGLRGGAGSHGQLPAARLPSSGAPGADMCGLPRAQSRPLQRGGRTNEAKLRDAGLPNIRPELVSHKARMWKFRLRRCSSISELWRADSCPNSSEPQSSGRIGRSSAAIGPETRDDWGEFN